VIDEQRQQGPEPGSVIGDTSFGDQLAVVVDQGDVVMAFGPVDSAPNPHPSRPSCHSPHGPASW
jgi:hypothetical protein